MGILGVDYEAQLRVLEVSVRCRHPDVADRIRQAITREEATIKEMMRHRFAMEIRDTIEGESMELGLQISMHEERINRLADLLVAASKFTPRDRGGPTIEQLGKPAKVDPMDKLLAEKRIGMTEYHNAMMVRWVVEQISKGAKLAQTHMDGGGRSPVKYWREPTPTRKLGELHSKVYVPWTEKLRRYHLALIMAVVVDGQPIYRVAKRHKISRARCITKLREGLKKFGA